MKTKMLGVILLIGALFLPNTVKANQTGTKNKPIFIWSANLSTAQPGRVVTTKLPAMDLNSDSKLEGILIITRLGTSQNGNTLKIFSGNGELIVKLVFSSAGGCAILGKTGSRQKQLVCWDYFQKENEAHQSDHQYWVYLYDWDQKGKLVPMLFFKTRKKYSYDFKVRGPFDEFQTNRKLAHSLVGLTRKPLALAVRKQLLPTVRKYNRRNKILEGYQVGDWVLTVEGETKDMSEIMVYEKGDRGWLHIKSGSDGTNDPNEAFKQYGVPQVVWKKLWPY